MPALSFPGVSRSDAAYVLLPILVYASFFAADFDTASAGFRDTLGDTFALPAYPHQLSYVDVFVFSDRQPPLFLAYVKTLSLLFGGERLFAALVAGNVAMTAGIIAMNHSILKGLVGGRAAFAANMFVAFGYEFYLYSAFTRYEVFGLFFCTVLVHQTCRSLRAGGGGQVWSANAAALLLALSRDLFFYLAVLGAAFNTGVAHARRPSARALVPLALFCLVILAVVAKNQVVYDYAGFTSWSYSPLQHLIWRTDAIPAAHNLTYLRELINKSGVSPEAKAYYLEVGGRWPTEKETFKRYPNNRTLGYLIRTYPKKGYDSFIYDRDFDGYLVGPATRLGYEVALEVVSDNKAAFLFGVPKSTLPLALCYSPLFFSDGGSCGFGAMAAALEKSDLMAGRRDTWWVSADLAARAAGFERAYRSFFPGFLIGAHLVFQMLAFPTAIAAAALSLPYFAYCALARKRRLDEAFVLSAVIVYGFAVSVYGTFPENMRYGFSYKIFVIDYAVYLAAAGLKAARRARV
jgi:hypothetical protein